MLRARPVHRRHRLWFVVAAAGVAAVVAAVLVPLSAEATGVQLSGVVDGPTGSLLGGVTVDLVQEFSQPGQLPVATTTSASNGTFAFSGVNEGPYTLWFEPTKTTYGQYLGNATDLVDSQQVTLSTDGGATSYVQANLRASGSVTGKVTKLPSGALSGYTVNAYGQSSVDASWSIESTTKTSSSGAYTLTGLAPGIYRLEAIDESSANPTYAAAYSGGATTLDTATSVGVLASKSTTYAFALGKAGSASGTVTGIYSGSSTEPVPGTRITVYRLGGTPGSFTSATALASPSATTSATGSYTVSALAPGNYTLEFEPPATASANSQVYGRTFLGSADTAISASYFTITNATVITGQDIQLQPEAKIEGVVEDSSSDTLSDVEVIADYVGGNADSSSEHAVTTFTDSNGTFEFDGLGAGTYILWVGSIVAPAGDPNAQTGWIRQQVPLPAISSGDVLHTSVTMTLRDNSGLWPTTLPTIDVSGGTSVGDTVAIASTGVWDASPNTFTYQWIRGGLPIAGATGDTYTLQPGDSTYTIWARVTATNFGYGSQDVQTSNTTGSVGSGTIPDPSPAPTLGAATEVGQTLTATPGVWDAPGVVLSYDWQVSADGSTNWTDVAGTGPTHLITGSDVGVGTHFRVDVIADANGYDENSAYAYASGTANDATQTLVKLPTVVKKTIAGVPYLSLSAGDWSPSNYDSEKTVWTIENSNLSISTITGPTLDVVDAGEDYITVQETHQKAGYTDVSTPLILVQTGAAPNPENEPITGTPRVGYSLTAPNTLWDPNAGTSSYQWAYKSGSSWKDLANGTGVSYTPVASDVGHTLRVVTTRRITGYAPGTLDTVESTPIALGAAPTSSGGGTAGYPGTGDTVQVISSTWSNPLVQVSYQWQSSANSAGPFTSIAGATNPSYLIPTGLSGQYLSLLETATVAGYAPGTTRVDVGTISNDYISLGANPKVTKKGTLYTVSGGTTSPVEPTSIEAATWYYTDNNDATVGGGYTTAVGVPVDLSSHLTAGAHWFVVVSIDASGIYAPTNFSPVLVQKGDFAASGGITLPASTVGTPVTPSSITWKVNNPQLGYQWEYKSGSNWKTISAAAGGTGATFTPSVSYFGKEVRLIETASRTNYTSLSVTSSSTTVGVGATLQPGTGVNAAEINGYLAIGQKLTATPGTWAMSGVSYHYVWSSSPDGTTWTPIAGATSSTYLIPDAAYGTLYYEVTITGSKTGYTDGTTTAKTVSKPGAGQINVVKDPVVSFTKSTGTYSITNGTWSPTPTSYEYYWYAYDPTTDDETLVASGTNSFTPSPSIANEKIVVNLYPDKSHYNSEGFTATVHTGPSIEPASALALTGDAVVESTLTITNASSWNTPAVGLYVTWYRNGVATGTFVNSTSYTLGTADLGKTITAQVRAAKDGYASYDVTLTSTAVYSNVALVTTVDPAISGSATVDDVVTSSTGTWNVSGLTFTYQWYLAGTAILGATSSSYQVAPGDENQLLTVGVTAHKALYEPAEERATDQTVAVGATPTIAGSSPVKISGTAVLGDTLSSSVGTWSLPVTTTYQWEFYDTGDSAWEYIGGATARTYTLAADDGLATGMQVRLEVTGQRAGHPQNDYDSNVMTIS